MKIADTELKSQTSINLVDEDFFNDLREKEYSRLNINSHTYLDYTGGNLYSSSQIKAHQDLLLGNVFGNPHSTNPTSQSATALVEETRNRILEFFNAKDYICIFTQNASGSLKIVGECYPFTEKSTLLLLADNHNSVNGIREFCHSRKGTARYVPVQYEALMINENTLKKELDEAPQGESKLFAFPAQSNVSGVKHDLKWIKYAQDKGFDVLLDAAAYVPSSKLDLSEVKPDFVSISFYKIFGYPTGLGCLLMKKTVFPKMVKPWFAGGTVTLVSVNSQNHFLANSHERFEDGTLNYLDIPAIKIGLDYISSIGINRISKRVKSLIETLATELKNLKHQNGQELVRIFGPQSFDSRGGNIIMNFFDNHGEVYPIGQIENMANKNMISIRTGCFCNPGIDEINNCITTEEISKYFISRDKGDYFEMISFLGKMRGATRVSVGLATNATDIVKFINLIKALQNKTVSESIAA